MTVPAELSNFPNAPLTRQIVVGLGCLTGIVVVLLLGAAFLAAHRVDEVSLTKEKEVVAHAFEERIATLERQQQTLADWGEAVAKTHLRDTAWLIENLGSRSRKSFGFDWSIVLDGQSVVMSYRDGDVLSVPVPTAVLNTAAALREKLIKSANGPGVSPTVSLTDVIDIDGKPAIISVRPILRNFDRLLASNSAVFYHVAIIFLDAESLTAISHHANVQGLKSTREPATAAHIPVLGNTNAIVTYLTWQPLAPGLATIWGLAPLGSVAVALAAFLAVFISRWLVDASRLLSRNEYEVRQHRDELEMLVLARTAEIETKNAELDRLLQQEREASALQRRFVSMISHEFRTPLAIIDAAAQRITRSRTAAPDYHMEKCVQIKSAVARMVELMESILAAGRIETGAISINKQSCSLIALIEECVKRRREITPGHRIHMDLEGLPATIALDTQSMERAISNLLSNAVKYAPHSPDVFVRGWRDCGCVSISIADTGIGMDADDLPRLFQPYFRARSASGIAGTGIGLNIVREIVELHGGTITAESKINEGTTFTIRIPFIEQGAEEYPCNRKSI